MTVLTSSSWQMDVDNAWKSAAAVEMHIIVEINSSHMGNSKLRSLGTFSRVLFDNRAIISSLARTSVTA
jgi:hypothetical protein